MLQPTENSYTLVSAATSDIGFAIVQRLSLTNNILLHGRDLEKLEKIKEKIETTNEIRIWAIDLKEVDKIQPSLKAYISENDISVSGFVHCAGTLRILPVKNFRLDYAREIFDVNFFSAVEIIKTLLTKVNNNALKNIVLISAVYSKFGNKGNTIYAASKGALDSLVKSLALELAPNVRVNSVLPGAVRTKMTDHIFEDPKFLEKFREDYILGEGDCGDIAAMVAFLISKDAKWITGQSLLVDGGYACH